MQWKCGNLAVEVCKILGGTGGKSGESVKGKGFPCFRPVGVLSQHATGELEDMERRAQCDTCHSAGGREGR